MRRSSYYKGGKASPDNSAGSWPGTQLCHDALVLKMSSFIGYLLWDRVDVVWDNKTTF